jgi:hypothetical protein
MVTTVAAILANPRYTGRQVWNRQQTDHQAVDEQGELLREQEVQRRSPSSQWVISRTVVHPPLVSEEQVVRVQAEHTAPVPADGMPRDYVLAGLVFCGICGRLMDSHWVHERASYRCRHGRTCAHPGASSHPKILYAREDHLLASIRSDRQLRRQFTGLGSLDPDVVVGCLRAHDMVVIGDHDGWVVESAQSGSSWRPPQSSGSRRPQPPLSEAGEQNRTIIAFGVEITCPRSTRTDSQRGPHVGGIIQLA